MTEATMSLLAAQRLAERLRNGLAWARSRIIVVGSVRREKAAVHDLDILLLLPPAHHVSTHHVSAHYVSAFAEGALANLQIRPGQKRLKILTSVSSGPRRRSAVVRSNGADYKVDFFLARHEEKPYALFHHTGSSAYNIRVRSHAKARGWKLNQYGLFSRETGKNVRGSAALRSERELAAFLGISFRPPADRSE